MRDMDLFHLLFFDLDCASPFEGIRLALIIFAHDVLQSKITGAF